MAGEVGQPVLQSPGAICIHLSRLWRGALESECQIMSDLQITVDSYCFSALRSELETWWHSQHVCRVGKSQTWSQSDGKGHAHQTQQLFQAFFEVTVLLSPDQALGKSLCIADLKSHQVMNKGKAFLLLGSQRMTGSHEFCRQLFDLFVDQICAGMHIADVPVQSSDSDFFRPPLISPSWSSSSFGSRWIRRLPRQPLRFLYPHKCCAEGTYGTQETQECRLQMISEAY